MINSEEFLFVVDETNQPLEPQIRSLVHKNGLWHRTTGIWVINSKKQILCHKRSPKKDIKPGYWEAFFGGHLGSDETYQDNAFNEMKEELGVMVDKNALIPYKVLKSNKPTHKEFQHIFGLILDNNIGELKFEKEEIDELKWIDLEEVRKTLTDAKIVEWVKKPWDDEVLHWLEKMTLNTD